MKVYICECGKEFVNPQSFNGHKSHCKIHLGDKWEARQVSMQNWIDAGKMCAMNNSLLIKEQKEVDRLNWFNEKHYCETCGAIITEFIGSGRFCSTKCAHAYSSSFVNRSSTNKTVKSVKLTEEEKQLRKEQRLEQNILNKKEKYQKYLLDSSGYTEHMIRKFRPFFLEEQNCCCAICGMKNEWQGKPLIFILDHIDGDSTNNDRKNLRFICPNCDSQLDTYKSKNKHSTRDRKVISKKDYELFIKLADC